MSSSSSNNTSSRRLLTRRGVPVGGGGGIRDDEEEEEEENPNTRRSLIAHASRRRVVGGAAGSAAGARRLLNNARNVLFLALVVIGRTLQTLSNVTLLVQLSSAGISSSSSRHSQEDHVVNNKSSSTLVDHGVVMTSIAAARRDDDHRQPGADDHMENDDDAVNAVDDRPLFVLHVGIPKTGTSFLQCSICGHYYENKGENNNRPGGSSSKGPHHEQYFAQDNFTYIGTCPCLPSPGSFVAHRHDAIFKNGVTWNTEHSLGPFPFDQNDNNNTKLDKFLPIPKLTRSFRNRVQAVHKQNKNALFIFEGSHKFDERHVQALAAFLHPRFRVQVLVTYRRLYEWLPSKYNSVMKPGHNRHIVHWPTTIANIGTDADIIDTDTDTEGDDVDVDENEDEDDDGDDDDDDRPSGVELKPFHLHLDVDKLQYNEHDDGDDFDQLVRDIVTTRKHPTQVVRDNYAKYFSNVQVISLHSLTTDIMTTTTTASKINTTTGSASSNTTTTANSSPYLEHLFCHVLHKNTPHICQALLDGNKFQLAHHATNPSVPLHFDAIAVEAWRRGWIPTSASRPDTRRAIEKYYHQRQRRQRQQLRIRGLYDENVTALVLKEEEERYQDCLSPTVLHQLLNLSLTTEHNLFAAQHPSQQSSSSISSDPKLELQINDDDDDHRHAFESYRQGKKYCWLNATKFLQHNVAWQMFLQRLGQQLQLQ